MAKSFTVAELGKKGALAVRTVPLVPLHEMAELRGSYAALTARAFYANTSYPNDYMHITLTDENDIPEALARLRVIYHNLMKLDYDNRRTRSAAVPDGTGAERKSPLALFGEFYEKQNGAPMSAEQTEWVAQLIEKVWEGTQ